MKAQEVESDIGHELRVAIFSQHTPDAIQFL